MILLLRYGAYPSILLACVIGNLVLFHMGTGVLPATYLPVTLGTLLIMALEALGADVVVSTTGAAGPDPHGGPVGTMILAVRTPEAARRSRCGVGIFFWP